MSEGHRIPSLSPPLNPPPPLLAIDQPNPPNIVISKNTDFSQLSHLQQHNTTNGNGILTYSRA